MILPTFTEIKKIKSIIEINSWRRNKPILISIIKKWNNFWTNRKPPAANAM
jgi:hypothetical protein